MSAIMGRKPRVHFPGAVYHVITRGNQKQIIFKDREGYSRFLNFLDEAQTRFSFKLYAYVLMPNHVHLLMEVGSYPLAKVMQTLLYRYTRYFNNRYRKVGHLFQGRYRAILCDKDHYLLELVRYLHLNPVRAGLVKEAKRYPWSSHEKYLKGRDEGGVAVGEVLAYWSKQRGEAIKRYTEFVLEGIEHGHREDYYRVKDQRYLGDEEFIDRVEKARDNVNEASPVTLTVQEAAERTVQFFGANPHNALDKIRGHEASRLRAIAAYVAREVGGIKLTETARYFTRDLSTLSLRVKKLEEEMNEQPALRERLRQLCDNLRTNKKRKYQITKA